jgi:hypothetical protein
MLEPNVDSGLFSDCGAAIRFRVDNLPPSPGPLGVASFGADNGGLEGFFSPTEPTATFDARPLRVSAAAVVANTIANQLHKVNLDLWVGGECTAQVISAIATIQVYH